MLFFGTKTSLMFSQRFRLMLLRYGFLLHHGLLFLYGYVVFPFHQPHRNHVVGWQICSHRLFSSYLSCVHFSPNLFCYFSGSKIKKYNNLTYDILRCVTLAVGMVKLAEFCKIQPTPPSTTASGISEAISFDCIVIDFQQVY